VISEQAFGDRVVESRQQKEAKPLSTNLTITSAAFAWAKDFSKNLLCLPAERMRKMTLLKL